MLDKNEAQCLQICKIKVLEKYKKDLCDNKVKFSDISYQLISGNYLSKEDCFEICSLPAKKQMKLFYEKVLKILEIEGENISEESIILNTKEKDATKDPWTILLLSLKSENPLLSCKMEAELQKLAKTDKPRRLTRDDIGTPLHFKHLHHIGQKPRRFLSLRSSSTTSSNSVDESDPDFKTFLSKVGVTTDHFRRPGTRRVILDFIDKNGGIDAIRQEIRPNAAESSQNGSDSDTKM